jgi:hypothetical protein
MSDRTKSLSSMLLVGLASAALFYLLREHWAHMFGILPYLLFLSCPLMHFFMHGKHGQGHDHSVTGGKIASGSSDQSA